MTEQQDEAALRTVQIMIKSPNGSDKDFCLTMPLDDTRVRDVKRLLHEQHPEHPEPGDQRLIFAGKLLTDDSLTADVLKQHDVSHPQTFHLMTPRKSASSSALPPQRTRTAPAEVNPRPAPAAPAAPAPSPVATAAPAPAAPATPAAPAAAPVPPYLPAGAYVPNVAPVLQPPVLAYAALQPNVPVLQMMDGQCYQLVVREWYGQPFVFPLPVLPTYVHAPFAPTGGVLGVPTHAGAATPAAAAAGTPAGGAAAAGAAAQAQDGGALPAGAGMGAGMAAAGGGGDFFDEGEEANTDSLKLLLKLALFVYILGQDGGLQRVLVLTAAAVAIFLAQTGRLDFVQRRLGGAARALDAGDAEPRAAAEGAGDEGARNEDGGQPRPEAGAQGDAPPEDGAPAAAAPPAPPPSLLRDIENVVVTFFTSLLPTWPGGEADQQLAAGGM